jgi:uncharacterized protein YndB with AHSA1/START domain
VREPMARSGLLWTGKRHGHNTWRHITGMQHAVTQGHRCSLAIARKDEGDEAKPMVGSPEHERWWRAGTMVEEDGGGRSSTHVR